jgi:hypothetical protein
MKIKYKIAPGFETLEGWVSRLPIHFPSSGKTFFKNRNEIKVFEVEGFNLNVKEFRVPNYVNRYSYVYLRESKAARSFNYSLKLRQLGVQTPQAVGYIECIEKGLLTKSYYISLHEYYDYTLREVLGFPVPLKEEIFRHWVRFTYEKLHKNGIFHLDYSQGNTLITEKDGKYSFSIVDLNRMEFGPVDFKKGLTNFCRLGLNDHTIELVATEYARVCGEDEEAAKKFLLKFNRKTEAAHQRWQNTKSAVRKLLKSGRGGK